MITVTVPAKIHLLGEHTSVYGKPALLAAINKRITIQISNSSKNEGIVLKKEYPRLVEFQKNLESAIKKEFKVRQIHPYKLEITSEIPIGSGLGSSASFSAGITAALLQFLKLSYSEKQLYEIAYLGESFFHGNPSGGDLAAVVNGGFTYFRKEFEFLKTFSKLPFGIHKNIKQFYLIDSGKPVESTKELVSNVGKLKQEKFKIINQIFDDQEQLVKEMVMALKDGNESELIRTIRLGEKNLEKLGVVGKKAKTIIRLIEQAGGAAKIMGGGGIQDGAGMILVYFKTKPKKLEFELIPVTIEEEGVTIHE